MDYKTSWKTAQNIEFSLEVINEINILRKNPKQYLQLLDSYIEGCEDDCIFYGGSEIGTQLEEGKSVVSEPLS